MSDGAAITTAGLSARPSPSNGGTSAGRTTTPARSVDLRTRGTAGGEMLRAGERRRDGSGLPGLRCERTSGVPARGRVERAVIETPLTALEPASAPATTAEPLIEFRGVDKAYRMG